MPAKSVLIMWTQKSSRRSPVKQRKSSVQQGKHYILNQRHLGRPSTIHREDAIIAVTTSLANAQSQIHDSSPQMKKFVKKHGKGIIVLVDKSLKNPIVVTGISRFAKSR